MAVGRDDRHTAGLEAVAAPRLRLGPNVRQALAILQMSASELDALVQDEMLSNPLLEASEDGHGDQSHLPEGEWEGAGAAAGRSEGQDEPPLPADADRPLGAHLHGQAASLDLPPARTAALRFLIDSLDQNGYLGLDPGEAAQLSGVPRAEMERALEVLRSLDPPGVGSRSLAECLLLQWGRTGDEDPLVPRLIAHHLDDLARRGPAAIAAALGATPAAVQEAADKLRRLEPKPGRGFGAGAPPALTPDLFVRPLADGCVVLVNDTAVRRPAISRTYQHLIAGGEVDAPTRAFLRAKLARAAFVLRCIEQRRVTLLRVMEAIVDLQRGFFEGRTAQLRPLTMREAAGCAGVHESTVSRAAAGKYVHTSHGLLPMKAFFSRAVSSTTGPRSAATVRRLIATLVASEDPERPLSDAAITGALAGSGVTLSRRAVANYRRSAGIPAAPLRRRFR